MCSCGPCAVHTLNCHSQSPGKDILPLYTPSFGSSKTTCEPHHARTFYRRFRGLSFKSHGKRFRAFLLEAWGLLRFEPCLRHGDRGSWFLHTPQSASQERKSCPRHGFCSRHRVSDLPVARSWKPLGNRMALFTLIVELSREIPAVARKFFLLWYWN